MELEDRQVLARKAVVGGEAFDWRVVYFHPGCASPEELYAENVRVQRLVYACYACGERITEEDGDA